MMAIMGVFFCNPKNQRLCDKNVSDGGDRVGGDTSNPTHITPTRTRDNVGASDKNSIYL